MKNLSWGMRLFPTNIMKWVFSISLFFGLFSFPRPILDSANRKSNLFLSAPLMYCFSSLLKSVLLNVVIGHKLLLRLFLLDLIPAQANSIFAISILLKKDFIFLSFLQKKLSLVQTFACHSHRASVRSLAVGGAHLASGSTDETIRLYDVVNQVESGLLTHHNGIKFM